MTHSDGLHDIGAELAAGFMAGAKARGAIRSARLSAALGLVLGIALSSACSQSPLGEPEAGSMTVVAATASLSGDRPSDRVFPPEIEILNDLAPAAGMESRAGPPAYAARFIQELGDHAIAVMADQSLGPDQKHAAFRGILLQGFDVDTIGRIVLGRYWRRATPKQQAEYQRLFETFVVSVYASRFERYSGERLIVVDARPDKKNVIVVKSRIEKPGRSPAKVDWLVRQSAEGYRIIDVVVEGVSMAITQRSEFAAIIQSNGGDLAGLLTVLKERAI